ncbi:MAG: CheR family methyltransferase [Acidobacteriota bacterium]
MSPGPPKAGSESVELLQWALPRLSFAWPGFRRVRRQVCRRIGRRVQDLKLPDWEAYRLYLETHPEEWALLDSLCRIPVSRFFRDRVVFERIGTEVLPGLAQAAMARGERRLNCWSAGCASGEEPYSLMILWRSELARRFPDLSLAIIATDIDEKLIERARAARYRASSLRELPSEWIDSAFARSGSVFELRQEFRQGIEFRCEDIRKRTPAGPFDLILCRNLAFTYFGAPLQRETAERILRELRPGGALVVGLRERLPEGMAGVAAWDPRLKIYRKLPHGDTALPGSDPAIGTAAADDALEIGVERWS